ncbi:20423_t:CDS:1, partial [Racocetra persica]
TTIINVLKFWSLLTTDKRFILASKRDKRSIKINKTAKKK